MFDSEKWVSREENYRLLVRAVQALAEDEKDEIAVLSNISALISFYMDDINWAGFYIMRGSELVLGPFQGLPACLRIKPGKGVCGTAAIEKRVLLVENVHDFPGHIACDGNCNSEIVLPIFRNNMVYGVLDIDSPLLGRFTEAESATLQQVVSYLQENLNE